MADRLPRPFFQIGFAQGNSVADCLRSALQQAKLLRVGILFRYGGQKYLVQPEMPVEDVLALADPELAASVKTHVEEHSG